MNKKTVKIKLIFKLKYKPDNLKRTAFSWLYRTFVHGLF